MYSPWYASVFFKLPVQIFIGLLVCGNVFAQVQHMNHQGMNMKVTASGFVMNNNVDNLPAGCSEISEDVELRVRAGHKFAVEPGQVFAMDKPVVRVPGCSRLTVVFENTDGIRHQWMVHGLPKYLYQGGMFHIESNANRTVRGTFIVPPEDKSYLVHCDMTQHMEKGMRGMLVVGDGSGRIWSIPGETDYFYRASYLPKHIDLGLGLGLVVLCLLGAVYFVLKLFRWENPIT
tara:strand:- start:250 stop:945 length:696 start_codon:yes stop_codon:yes gene_type:complete